MSTKRFISYPKNNNIYRGDITGLFENYSTIYFSKNDIIYYDFKYYIFLKNYTWTYSSWVDNESEDFDEWIDTSLDYGTISRWFMLDPILSNIGGGGNYAPINSPAFTGTPTVPTPASNNNSSQIANTSWVKSQISSFVTESTVNNKIFQGTKIQFLYVYDSDAVDLEVGDTHDQAFSKLDKRITDNEYVVAEAITDLDSKIKAPLIIDCSGGIYDMEDLSGTWNILTGACPLSLEILNGVTPEDIINAYKNNQKIYIRHTYHGRYDIINGSVHETYINVKQYQEDSSIYFLMGTGEIQSDLMLWAFRNSYQNKIYILTASFDENDSANNFLNIIPVFNNLPESILDTSTHVGKLVFSHELIMGSAFTPIFRYNPDDSASGTPVVAYLSDLENISSGDASTMIKVTYEELKSLRDSMSLKPGCWYRLTDYECTTTTTGTKSAGHKFDIIILALSENSLSEECRAMLNEDNIYDVSIRHQPFDIRQKCYIYQYDDLNYSVVDVSTLKGVDVSISSVSINENNKTASINQYISELNLTGLSINYFNPWLTWRHNKSSCCNILSWKIWYTLDNIRWSNAHDAYTCYDVTATIMGESQRITVHQYYNAWVGGYSYTNPDTNITYYCWSTGGDSVDFWTTTLNIASGSYTIYMGGYLPNPDYAVPADIIVHGTLNVPKGKGTIYRMIDDHNNDCPWDFKNILFSKEINGSSKWVYTFTANIATGEILDGTIERQGPDDGQGFYIRVLPSNNNTINNLTYLPNKGIILFNPDGGQYTEEESELHDYNSCRNNFILSGSNISISGSDNNLDDYCYDVSITGMGNKLGRSCHNIIFYGSDNNTLGSGCDYITLSNYNQYNIFGNDIHHVSFNSEFIQGAVVENGISWVNLSTSGTTSWSNRLRGVTIATGFAGTEATPKNIVHATLNDTFKTIYQPANSQVISI